MFIQTMYDFKLVYFGMRGRAEFVRFLFHYAEVPFVDEKIDQSDWAVMKPDAPFNHLPILHVDDKILTQTVAIGSFLGGLFGLDGVNRLESARCLMVGAAAESLFTNIMVPWAKFKFFQNDEEKAAELWEEMLTEKVPKAFGNLERLLGQNEGVWFVGDKENWCDIIVGEILGRFVENFETILDDYPNLKQLVESVHELPNIKKYTDQRETPRF